MLESGLKQKQSDPRVCAASFEVKRLISLRYAWLSRLAFKSVYSSDQKQTFALSSATGMQREHGLHALAYMCAHHGPLPCQHSTVIHMLWISDASANPSLYSIASALLGKLLTTLSFHLISSAFTSCFHYLIIKHLQT